MRRMMKSCCDVIMPRVLTLVVAGFFAVSLAGCLDPTIANMEAERRELGFTCEQELQRCRTASRLTSQARSLPPAQAADMEAERRELDSMVQRGRWQTLSGPPPASQAEAFHPAP